MRDVFSDPFFTDPNYMKKQERKFWLIGLFMMLVMASFYFILISATVEVGKDIQNKGGLGNVIGRFLQDVQNPEPIEESK